MELRDIFTRDIRSDSNLVAAYVLCLNEAQPLPNTVRYGSDFIDLKPYEVIVAFEHLSYESGLTADVLCEKLKELVKLRRAVVEFKDGYARVQLVGIRFPIKPPLEPVQPSSQVVEMSLNQWVEKDLAHIERNFSHKYLEMNRLVLRGFVDIVGNKSLSEISKADYAVYVGAIQRRTLRGTNEKIKNTSVNDYTRALKASIRRAVGDYMKEDPFLKTKPLRETRRPAVLIEPEEYSALRQLSPEWFRDLTDFMILTGARRGEAVNLLWQSVSLDEHSFQVCCTENFDTKFQKERPLWLCQDSIQILSRVLDRTRTNGFESDYVFLDDRGKKILGNRAGHLFRDLADAVGVRQEVTLHSLRRTHTTRLKQNRIATNTIRAILGHSSCTTTDRYIGTPTEDVVAAMEGLSLSAFLPR